MGLTFVRLLGLAVLTAAASIADTVFVGTANETIYRLRVAPGGTSLETFAVDHEINALALDSSGRVLAAPGDVSGTTTLFELVNAASGTPALSPVSQLQRNYRGLTEIDGLLHAFAGDDRYYTIDISNPASPIETPIAQHADELSGAAYDPVNDLLYGSSAVSDTLQVVDRATGNPTVIGPFGHNALRTALDWFEGDLYLLTQNDTSGLMEIGTLNPMTGAYQSEYVLDSLIRAATTGLVVVPEPASLTLLFMLGVLGCARGAVYVSARGRDS